MSGSAFPLHVNILVHEPCACMLVQKGTADSRQVTVTASCCGPCVCFPCWRRFRVSVKAKVTVRVRGCSSERLQGQGRGSASVALASSFHLGSSSQRSQRHLWPPTRPDGSDQPTNDGDKASRKTIVPTVIHLLPTWILLRYFPTIAAVKRGVSLTFKDKRSNEYYYSNSNISDLKMLQISCDGILRVIDSLTKTNIISACSNWKLFFTCLKQ